MTPEQRADHWQATLRLLTTLLFIWFAVSLGCGLLLAEPLNAIQLGGCPLGFWFAQQGAIPVFVALIFIHAWRMDRRDRACDISED